MHPAATVTPAWGILNCIFFIHIADAARTRCCNPLFASLDAHQLMAVHVLVVGDRSERVLVSVFEDGALAARIDRLLEEGVSDLAFW